MKMPVSSIFSSEPLAAVDNFSGRMTVNASPIGRKTDRDYGKNKHEPW